MKKISVLLYILCFGFISTVYADRIDMKQAGADTKGTVLNTKLINTTIERLNADGGGTLYFPAGTYLTGPIEMKSNITLDLEAGAILRFSDNFDDYLPYMEIGRAHV